MYPQTNILVAMDNLDVLNNITDDFQSVVCALKSLFVFFVLFHVRHHKI